MPENNLLKTNFEAIFDVKEERFINFFLSFFFISWFSTMESLSR
jgi:hypothetical protein